MKTEDGDTAAYQYAAVYAQWGDTPKALEWLDTAWRLRDPGLIQLKTDPLMDPIRHEPRFQKVMQDLRFPNQWIDRRWAVARRLQRETRYSDPIIRSGRRRHANGSIARNAADWISRGTG